MSETHVLQGKMSESATVSDIKKFICQKLTSSLSPLSGCRVRRAFRDARTEYLTCRVFISSKNRTKAIPLKP